MKYIYKEPLEYVLVQGLHFPKFDSADRLFHQNFYNQVQFNK